MPLPSYILWPLSIILGVFLFSLAVFIHELGHFVVARLLGLRADVFSIGFGPALWKRRMWGTELRFSAIPFGGYVSLPQLDPEGMQRLQGEHGETLPPACPWKRILVALAGPMGNLVLALICAAAISWFAPEGATGASTTIGYVEPDSSAWEAGLRKGDRLLSVNGTTIRSWSDFQTECFLSGGTNDVVTLTYERAGKSAETNAVLDTQLAENEPIYGVGGMLPGPLELGIGSVEPDSPAAQAGLQPGDRILSVDGVPFERFEQLTRRADPTAPVTLEVRSPQTGETTTVSLRPVRLAAIEGDPEPDRPRLGIVMAMFGEHHFQWMAERGVWAQIGSDASGVVRVLKALTLPQKEGEAGRAAKGLGGPLMILGMMVQVVQMGLWISLGFLRLICVNLALLNLLPLPVLDGGHILFALYALIRRKEVSPKVIGWLTNVFACLLIGLMLLLVFRDSLRFVTRFFG